MSPYKGLSAEREVYDDGKYLFRGDRRRVRSGFHDPGNMGDKEKGTGAFLDRADSAAG